MQKTFAGCQNLWWSGLKLSTLDIFNARWMCEIHHFIRDVTPVDALLLRKVWCKTLQVENFWWSGLELSTLEHFNAR
ncbi:hypothetical protein TNIN_327871 [Trichonephila inaurata madagascariensis]|uniref:Uncharacterized protein n=1 Tax=Trichonephila inaurata madagascariensis TaxID=2747483 RepID=A0A8X6JE11_9ARAC|nr:hypothetical protein TNIN_327871 [Trichonephila inaurata madagascariensis]